MADPFDRRVLPIHEPDCPSITARYLADAPPPPPRFSPTPPLGAPNVLLILLDDMGFGASRPFGGPIPMPAAERLAAQGRRFTRFHTAAVCSASRAALLSGYNHHSVNMGNVSEFCTAYPGNTSVRPRSVTPLSRVLRENGYRTAMFGKSHETPAWEVNPTGPYDHWPTFSGFEKFYGFLGAETNQYAPELYDGITPVDTPTRPGYHLTEDLAQQCCEWIRLQHAVSPDTPFFAYLAPGATHSPHQVPRPYIDRFRGCFDEGWDVLRQRTLEHMKQQGVVPPDTLLARKPTGIPDWDSLSDREKRLCAREMEVYAGFAYHTDLQVGRVLDCLQDLGLLQDTLVFYILGDNGASAEGGLHGSVNEFTSFNRTPDSPDALYARMDDLGAECSYGHYAAGWAVAMDAPFTWVKGVASDFGGTRTGMIVSYPARYAASGEVCAQFHHVIDVAPTILDICGIPAPEWVDGVRQRPIEGISMEYALRSPAAKDRRTTQYFRVMGHCGIYHDGWFAGMIAPTQWEPRPWKARMEDEPWELYHITDDYACAVDLALRYPEKLHEMKELFFQEAARYHALPLDPRGGELFQPRIAGRPDPMGGRTEITLSGGMTGFREQNFLNLKNTSFRIEAEVETAPGHTNGVLFCQGGRFGGYALYIREARPVFCYNWLGREWYYIRSDQPIADPRSRILLRFQYDGGGDGKGGTATLSINGRETACGRIEHTIPYVMCSSETASVGLQRSTCVTPEYTVETSRFQGDIYSVHIVLDR